ncbi:MAG TPA: hydrogenase nickel incorporation protein HypB [Candidatus Tumulicola sp.]|nr:hydrogenase nickel incorporation protein HypB [Candidatus Tumulicola sp.]
MNKMRVVAISRNLMAKNDAIAQGLRERFAASGTLVVNVLSSPGSGKTTLLERTLERFGPRYRAGVLVGDQATDNDAQRLRRPGVSVVQITTGAECRLDADMVAAALERWGDEPLDVLFIENVGNLICPAEYDLGEDLRVVLLSVTEGEDKPLKYPLAYNTSHVAIVTKADLAAAAGFDRDMALANVARVNPNASILEVSARTGAGMERWLALLEERIAAKSLATAG